jgi:chromosome segregation ATPase
LNYDHHLHRAFEFVCGSTLVAETLDQARKLAFDGETRRRVVTVDGSMISKSGLMTGGTAVSGKLAKNAKRWV